MARTFTILRGGEPVALPYGPFTDDDGVQHPVDVLDRWGDADLAGIGVLATEVADPLPSEVPMYKVRKYLIINALKTAVEAHLDSLEEPAKSLAWEDWEYAPNLVVASPLALGAKAALSLTDEQYADMIRAAAALA